MTLILEDLIRNRIQKIDDLILKIRKYLASHLRDIPEIPKQYWDKVS